MDNSVSPNRPDVVAVETTARPTATPVRVSFSEVLAGGARALVRGAQAAVTALPGAPLMAVAIRGLGSGPSTALALSSAPSAGMTLPTSAAPEGPGGGGLGAGADGSAAGTSDGIASSLAQSQQLNLYYLQVQQEVNDQNRTFTALSNCLEVENNTAKSAISNIH